MRFLSLFVPVSLILTLLFGAIYTTSQQVLRMGANDPQIEIAEDFAKGIEAAGTMQGIGEPSSVVDVATSLAEFEILFDDQMKPIMASGSLDGETPIPPSGVFDYTRAHGEDRITWQPKKGVRIAAVLVRVEGAEPGFVLSGRNLREVEMREQVLLVLTASAWLVSLLVACAGSALFLLTRQPSRATNKPN